MTRQILGWLTVVLIASLVPRPARAQAVGASLRGTITDATGGALPGATVMIVNVDTGATRELVTDGEGRYTAPILPPGEYEIHVSLTGFQPFARRGLRLTVGQDAALDVKLEVGQLAEEVTVTGAAHRSDNGRRERPGDGQADPRSAAEWTVLYDSSGINSQDFTNGVQYSMDWYHRTADRGPSSFSTPHNLTYNWTWDLPFGRSLTGLRGALLNGWQVNNIGTLMTGQAFSVRNGFNRSGNLNTTSFSMNERPNIKPGCDPILGGADRYWDINCFELQPANTQGNEGRNSLRGPGLISIDLAFVKSFQTAGSRSLQLRVEIFNVPNRTGRTSRCRPDRSRSRMRPALWHRIGGVLRPRRRRRGRCSWGSSTCSDFGGYGDAASPRASGVSRPRPRPRAVAWQPAFECRPRDRFTARLGGPVVTPLPDGAESWRLHSPAGDARSVAGTRST